MEQPFDIAVFPEVRYDHLLRGRTGAMIDTLRERGFFVYYFERPPDSPLQYFKDPIAYHRGFSNFLFPKPIYLDNLAVFSQPPIFPAKRFNKKFIKKYNHQIILRKVINNYNELRKTRRKPVVALVVTPWWYDIIDKMEFQLICYDCIDDIKVFCETNEFDYFCTAQKKLVKKSDLILISAQRLKEDIIKIKSNAPIEYLPNGVDAELFINNVKSAVIPDELKKVPKPIIGFIGSIFNWVDVALIKRAAQKYPAYSFVLVGPVQGIEVPNLPNIVTLGAKPYSTIPAYIIAFDVCIIPFIKDQLSDKVDPIKVYEYLSLGKPVVAINLAELEKMQSLIYLAKDDDDFVTSIQKALEEKDLELKNRRVKYALDNSWDSRVTKLIDIISSKILRTE
jgi:glycosyltransferase involved in cell wall biosynthesis